MTLAEEYVFDVLGLRRNIVYDYINDNSDCAERIDYMPKMDVINSVKKMKAGDFCHDKDGLYFVPNVERCSLYKKYLKRNKDWKNKIDKEISRAERERKVFGMRSRASICFRGDAIIDSVKRYMNETYNLEPTYLENPNGEFTLIVDFD